MIIVFDTETFKKYWCLVAYDMLTGEKTVISNDRDQLVSFYNTHKNYIWAAYNAGFDSTVVKSILKGYNPYDAAQFLIEEGGKPWNFDKSFNDIQLYTYDAMFTKGMSLKRLEAFMGESIVETEVDFSLDRELTQEEIDSTLYYCENDVLMLIKVMTLSKNEFFAKWGIIKQFNLPISDISKTNAQLAAVALGGVKKEFNDEWDLKFPEYDCKIEKYKDVVKWYFQPDNQWLRRMRPSKTQAGKFVEEKNSGLECEIAGCPCNASWGGFHGAKKSFFRKGTIVDCDVSSFYPRIMLEWDALSRATNNPKALEQVFNKRLELKAKGDTAGQLPLKRVINSVYGISGSDTSPLGDKHQAHKVCLTGQIMLIDLAEQIEGLCEIFNQNTDGIFFIINDLDNKEKIEKLCHDWEKRTRMSLEFDEYERIFQSQVNGYIACPKDLFDKKGRPAWKSKGEMVKLTSVLDNNLAVVSKAVNWFFVFGTEPLETIYESKNLIDFQNVFVRQGDYKYVYHNPTIEEVKLEGKKTKEKIVVDDGVLLTDKTFRVYPVTDKTGSLYKSKEYRKNAGRFAGAPDNLIIWNEKVNGLTVDAIPNLNFDWFIQEAWRRILIFYYSSDLIKPGFFEKVSEEKLEEMKDEVREKVRSML